MAKQFKKKKSVKVNPVGQAHIQATFNNIIISLCNGLVFIVLLYLLFYLDVKDTSRDLVNILVGAYVAVLAKSTDYWFKDKEDAEDKESAALNGNGDK